LAVAQRADETPKELEDVEVIERLNEQVPLDLPFADSDGRKVTLREYFDGARPVILTMNYSNCPMLCSLQLNGLFDGLERLEWDLGSKFQMITVSIDPKEIPERAEQTKQKYLRAYGRTGVANGWHCLTGTEHDIRRLADAVGFGFAEDPDSGEFIHAAVTMVCTPDGKLSRYLYGIEYAAQTLRLALLEASEGKIGSTMDQVLLFCFQYDPAKGRYAPAAFRIMQVGGLLTVVLVGVGLAVFWRREVKKARKSQPEPDS
jgi:protein SCO1/2